MSGVLRMSFDGVELAPILNAAQKRWRRAYTTVYSTRALLSLANPQNELLQPLLSSSSFTVIDIEPPVLPITITTLKELVQSKNLKLLHQHGGVENVALALKSNLDTGIQCHTQELVERSQAYGPNIFQRPPQRIWKIVLASLKDPIVVMLLVCGSLSLGFGITKHEPEGWSDGSSIFVAVSLVIIVTTFSHIWPKRQFDKLSKACDDILIEVIRNGQKEQISIFNAVVGDVVCLEVGNQVPADGLYIDGHCLKVDESNITSEITHVEVNLTVNPFLLSGTVVSNGSARMLVTAVGMNTKWGEMTSLKRHDQTEKTPLQVKLHTLTFILTIAGLVAAFLVLVVLFTLYFVGYLQDENGKSVFIPGETKIREVWKAITGILVIPVTVASAAIPEGLLLAITISIGYSTKMMAREHALVRNLLACEAIGAVTVICTNERVTLKLNKLKVCESWLGTKLIGEEDLRVSSIASQVLELLSQGIVCNKSTENQAEKVIYEWCVREMDIDVKQMTDSYAFLEDEISGGDMLDGSILIKRKCDESVHFHIRGSPRKILAMCSHHYKENGTIELINDGTRAKIEEIIQEIETNCTHYIAFAHKVLSRTDNNEDEKTINLNEECFNLLAFVGLKTPCEPEVIKALMDCRLAGVEIKMITKDNLSKARASAMECGIINRNEDFSTGEIVEGEEFRNYEENERLEKVDKIHVFARATTLDRCLVVKTLREKHHVVAVIGDRIEDASALREADIGIALGTDTTDIVKENSDIIIKDNSFASVVRVLRWGRGIYNNIQIFTQFQLTASIALLVTDIVTALSSRKPPTIKIVSAISSGKVPFAAVQLLWAKMIVGTLAAMALTVENPSEELMQQSPVNWNESFITNVMWKNIVIQAFYQILILLTIQFKGEDIFKLNSRETDTMVFNISVLCQIFIIFNTRKTEKNIFKGLRRNKLFWGIIGVIILLQVVMIELLKKFAQTERLNWQQWGICIVIGVLSCPFGWLIKSIPLPQPFLQQLKQHFYNKYSILVST